jgi:hypothetical protein
MLLLKLKHNTFQLNKPSSRAFYYEKKYTVAVEMRFLRVPAD